MFFIFALIAWALSASYFPEKYPELGKASYWIIGLISAGFLFVSVLFHEISHSLVARHFKIKVRSITLFFFGGVAELKEQKFTPKKEFWISVAGPAFSFAFALFFFLLMKIAGNLVYVEAVSGYLCWLNLILGFFNLVPGFPLDGGRIFRAILWKKTGSLERATYIASEAGKGFAIFMIVFGVAGIFFGGIGLWYILIGLFLFTLSKQAYKQTILKIVLEKVKVKDVMRKKLKSLSPETPLSRINVDSLVKYNQDVFPVMKGKTFMGLTSQYNINRAKQLGKDLKVGNITMPVKDTMAVKPADDCYKVFAKMVKHNMSALPIIQKGKLVAIVDANTFMRLVKLRLDKVNLKKKKWKK